MDVSVSLSCCVHGHTAVLSPVRNFSFHDLKRPAASKRTKKTRSDKVRLFSNGRRQQRGLRSPYRA